MNITGVMVQYYKACKRELWFFAHQINMDYESDDIAVGRLIHDKSFSREKKNINLGDVSFDFVEEDGEPRIYEIKKSSKLVEPVRYQLYYYLWYVKKMGIEAKGILVYPREKKREELRLTPKIEKEISNIVCDIPLIIAQPVPPDAQKKPYCKRCTYYELCMV
ncbi:MAG: CRISPR-associated protein Cas4 [Candidatus Thermoplasmatota archaeon]